MESAMMSDISWARCGEVNSTVTVAEPVTVLHCTGATRNCV